MKKMVLHQIQEDIEAAITDKTKLIMINFTIKPNGGVIPTETMDEIAAYSKNMICLQLTDEVYRTIVFDGQNQHAHSLSSNQR